MIVDDATHFTLWHQANASGQTAAAQADTLNQNLSQHFVQSQSPTKEQTLVTQTDIPNQSTVQDFIQRFAATKRSTLPQPSSSSEKYAWRKHSANISHSTIASIGAPRQNKGAKYAMANQPKKSPSTLLKIEPRLPLMTVPAEPLAATYDQTLGRNFAVSMHDPFGSPYLGPVFCPVPLPLC